jgi:hypothetical protein
MSALRAIVDTSVRTSVDSLAVPSSLCVIYPDDLLYGGR